MERVSSENLTIRPLASSNGNGSNGNMKLNSQYRHRRLTQEMRMLAEKETAARNEKTDMLREEIANAARTKQLLMQNAMERRRRRSERKFSRTILLDSITDSTIINDTLADVDSNTSSGSETISIILESAIGTKQDETSVAHRQRTNSTDKSTTLSLVAKFETKHHVDATVSSSKSIMNNKKMQPLSNGKITSTTSDQHVSNSQVASTSTTKRAAVAGAKQGVAHLIARYNTVKDDQSTTASYCKNNKTKQQQQQQQPSVAIVSENTDTNTPVDQVKSSSIASKSTLKSSLVDDTILEITELLAELNTTTASTDMIDDDTESITSVLINDHVNSPAISPTSQVEDSGIASSLDPTGISVELDMEDSIEVDTLLDSYFDGNDTASPSNVIDNAELSEILEDQHTSSILESVLDDNSDVSVSGMIEAQESTVSINIQLRKDSDAIRMINELRMLEEAEEQLRQSDLVTEQLLATARKGSVATIESLRSPRDPMLQDNSIISLSSYYDADLILNNSSVAVYDIRKSMRLEFNSNDVNGLLLSDKMPHPSRLSSDQSNDPSRSSNGSNSNSRLYMVDRHLLNHAGRLKSVTPVTAIKSELNLLVNDLFPTSTVSPSTVVPPPRYPTSSSSSAHTAISPSTASLGSSLSTTSTIASSSDMMVIDTRSGRTRKPASILSPLSDSSISVASMAEHRSSIIHNRHESPSEHGINTATAVTSSTKYESNISMSNATATESNNPIALMNDIPAIPLRSAPTIITVSAPLVPSEERIPDKTLAIIDPNAKPFASLDLQDTNRQLPPTNTKTEEGLTSPRKGMAAASRAESRRQRRKSGVAGTPDGRWSARSSRGQKSDTAQPASSDNNHLDDSQPDTYVAEEFRQILGQHLSNILTEELTDTNALEIDNGGSSSTLPNPHPSSLSDSDAAIRIVAVQGQKARIIFNEKPAPPPGQRPIITKSRGSPLSNDNPAPRIQPTFSTTSPLHRQSKHTIAPHLFNTAPPRHSRSSSFPSMDLCSVTMDSAISTSSPGATTPSTPSALCPRNMPAHKQLHRKSSSLSMSHIQYTNGAVNNAMFQREQHSLLAKSNAIRNNINTASTMQAESLVNGINNTGKASAVSSTITDANSTKTNTTVLHTRAPSESTIAKSIPISHQRSHSQPIIHSINHIERIASPVHRSSSSSSSSSTAQPALLQKSNTTLPTNRVSTTTTTSDKPQTSWENLPPWNQLYWSSNNGSNNDDSDADTSNRTISDTASSSKQQRQQQRQRQHSIEQQLKDDSIPMTSSMNTMLETASSPSTSPSLTSNPLQAMRRQPSTRAKALAESLSVGARTNSLAGTTATSIVETNKSTIHRPINTVSPTSENSPLVILTTYLKHFDFAETSIDLALRALLLDIPLPRQPEKIDCILVAFSNRFYECNPDMFSSVGG
ncbi:hypothetical protein BDF22DRAFT_441585 [Syncephalis plumigaleata]|nr:hypothetical protein BDF22DRAFT_441585 [Syncephalis plumigaleata]